MFNISLWFLLSLFIVSNIMYVIHRIKSSIVKLLVVVILGMIGYVGALFNLGNILFFMTSLTSLPFFIWVVYLRKMDI